MAHHKLDLTLYLVLDPILCQGEDGMIRTAELAAKAGVSVVQLRAPGWNTKELTRCGKKLKKALFPFGTALIVNNDAMAAKAIGAEGLHVGQNDISPKKAREILGNDVAIGLSITAASQLAFVDYSLIDYIGVGPVWSTTTKKDAAPAMGINQFIHIAKSSRVPAVAIGGIGPNEACLLHNTPAAGIAVVSAICGQDDIALMTRTLKRVFKQGE